MTIRVHWLLMAALFVSLAMPLAACGKRVDMGSPDDIVAGAAEQVPAMVISHQKDNVRRPPSAWADRRDVAAKPPLEPLRNWRRSIGWFVADHTPQGQRYRKRTGGALRARGAVNHPTARCRLGSLQMGAVFPAEHHGPLSTPLARTLRVATWLSSPAARDTEEQAAIRG